MSQFYLLFLNIKVIIEVSKKEVIIIMGKEFRLKLEKVFDFLGEIIAFITIAIWAVWCIDTNFSFLPPTIRAILDFAKNWGTLLLVAVEGFECTIKRNIIIRIVFYLLLAVVIIFQFFPDTWNVIITKVPGAVVTTTGA